ncbi:MAG: transposase [Candidatus Acidiferrum sp.]
MTISPSGRVTLRELMEQAWQQVAGQARTMLKAAVEGLLVAERDRRVAEATRRGEKVYRWGYTVRKCWTTLWGSLEQVHVPRLRGCKEIGLLERYKRHGLDEVLFALTVGGLSQRNVVGWVRRFLGGTLSPATIGAVLEQAQQQVAQRRSEAIPPGRYRAVVVDGIYLRYRRSVWQAARKGVLLVAVGVREGGGFDVLDWQGAFAETSEDYEALFTQLWRRGLESVELIVSDGLSAVVSAAQTVYPAARHQLCLAHWFRNLEALTPRFPWFQRRKFRREFWWIWDAEDEAQAREGARRFCARWRCAAPEMVQKFQAELHQVLAFFAFPAPWRHRLRTTNLGEGWFKHLRRYLSRFPGCRNAEHSEQVLGCFLLAAEQMHR